MPFTRGTATARPPSSRGGGTPVTAVVQTDRSADRAAGRPGPSVADPIGGRRAVAIVGAGPRGLGVLERLTANATEVAGDGDVDGLDIHLVDPWAPGTGRIWRRGQAPLLWMNSTVTDVTLWPDETVEMAGPHRLGPTLWEWIQTNHDRLAADPEVGPSMVGLHAGSFVSRSVQARYLGAVLDRVLAELPASVRVHLHRDRAVDVTDAADAVPAGSHAPAPAGRQIVLLESGATLTVDAVVLAQGHLDTAPGPDERARADFADRHGLTYLPPAYTADVDASVVPERADVLVSGLGLAFVDWVVVLAESRGGRFERAADGSLTYRPSGREPVLHAGSRRGVPYHAKISYPFPPRRGPGPRFFTAAAFADAADETSPGLDIETQVWPLLAKDLCLAHYGELFAAHPDRVRVDWETFLAGLTPAAWGTAAFEQVVTAAVPAVEDRLDLGRLARPLDGRTFTDPDDVQVAVREHVAADLARRSDPRFSSDAAVYTALLTVYAVLADLVRDGRIPAEVAAREVEGRFHAFFSFVASGPPPERLEQVLALSRAGVVRFLGPDLRVVLDEERGVFTASTALGVDSFSARTLIDARLPSASVRGTTDPLWRALADRRRAAAAGTGKLAVDRDQRVLRADGTPEPARFALGPWVVGNGWAPAFPRPRANGGFFRQDDALARTVLTGVGARLV